MQYPFLLVNSNASSLIRKRVVIGIMTATLTLILGIGTGGCSNMPAKNDSRQGPRKDVGALIRYDYAENELTQACQQAINEASAALSSSRGPITLLKLESTLAELGQQTGKLSFMASVSTSASTRAEAENCQKAMSQFEIGVFARRDLYDSISKQQPKSKAEKRLKKQTLLAFEKQGLKFSDDVVLKIKQLMQKLSDLSTAFGSNLDNDTSSVSFNEAELAGTPEHFKNRLKKSPSGQWIVTTKYPDYFAIMENAALPETRRKMSIAFENRQAKVNTQILEQAIGIRQQIATLLGYPTWADYAIYGRMAKDSKEVKTFLSKLTTQLSQASKQDLKQLLLLKQKEIPGSTELNPWDVRYYEYQLKKAQYSTDNETIRQYFPVDRVIQGSFDVYSKLLGVTFTQVENARVWAPEVHLYEISETKTGKAIAHFYADLFPRPGKYGHAAAFSIQVGHQKNGKYVLPISAIVANMEPPSADRPSLLTHDEVETFFHEFGHIMHQTLTKAPFASLAGTHVDRDFIEAPSQMLENWIWDPVLLTQISGHYEDPTQKLPKPLLNQMMRSRYFNKGYFYTRQLVLGLFDLKIHTKSGPVDTKKTYDDLYRKLVGIEPLREGHFAAGFGHMMGGYDAGYYGYLWSEVYAMDLFTRFKKEGLLNPKTGRDYRRFILEAGDMEDPMTLLTSFLKRKPSQAAFLKMIQNQIGQREKAQ